MNRIVMSFPFRLVLAAFALSLAPSCNDGSAPADVEPPLQGAAIGGPFTLIGKDGEAVQWDDFSGQYRMVYFGFTYCPDICPTDIQRMVKGLELFTQSDPERGDKVTPIFISVDPERDTPERVGQFADAFSARLVGLTGNEEQIAEAAKAFAVTYKRGEDTPGGGYLVNHSTIATLFGPDGKPLSILPTDKGPEAIADDLAMWVR